MSDDSELLRRSAFAKAAEGRYHRLKKLLDDPVTVTAAHVMRRDSVESLRDYQDNKPPV